MALVYTFDSTTLTGMTKFVLSEKVRIKKAIIPRRAGAVMDDHPVLDTRTVTMKGIIVRDTSALLNTAVNTLKAGIFAGKGELKLQDDRYLKATLSSFKEEYIKGFQDRGIKWSASFICEDPFWYSTSTEVSTPTALTAGNDIVVPCASTSGNALAHCTIIVNPDVAHMESISVHNKLTSIDKKWTYSSSDLIQYDTGGNLNVDSENKTCKSGGVNDLGNFEGDFFQIQCGTTNNLTVNSNVAISLGALYFEVEWTPRWY